MVENPLVSVLMTAYNRVKYIGEAIESVLASNYTNFELVIVDDCSTDDTILIAREYELKDSRIKIYQNEINLGQFANRNKAASYAKGEYLKYVDSDDIIYPFTLQMMVDGMRKFPNAALGFCLTIGPCQNPLPYMIDSKSAIKQHFLDGGLLYAGPSGLIIKKEAFEAVNGFEEFGMPSDCHLSLKLASRYPVVAMVRDLFWWRLHDGQVYIQNLNNHLNILNNYQYSKDIIINHSPLEIEQNEIILFNLKKIFISHLFRLTFKLIKPRVALNLLLQMKRRRKL